MLDRQKGNLVFVCDACGEIEDTGVDDFKDALVIVRRASQRAVKEGTGWAHYCQRCR